MKLDHSRIPVLEALVSFRERGGVRFGPPGHRQGGVRIGARPDGRRGRV
jgi:hypothetical protein